MKPENIVTISDLEKPRSIQELDVWLHKVQEEYTKTKDGRNYLRQGMGYTKQIYEELWPLLRYAQARYGREPNVELRPIIGSQSFDAIVKDTESEYKAEITFAKEGHEEYHKMKLLNSQGWVPVYDKLEVKGSKTKGYTYKLGDEVWSTDEVFSKYISSIVKAYKQKIIQDYSDVKVLIVGFDDHLVFLRDEDQVHFRTKLLNALSYGIGDFDRVWVVGMSGKFHVELHNE